MPQTPAPSAIVFLMTTIKRNNWTTQVLPSKYESSPAGASDLRREDLAPRASRHDRGGTEFLFFTSGPFEGARFFFSYFPTPLWQCLCRRHLWSAVAPATAFSPKFQGGSSAAALQDSKAASSCRIPRRFVHFLPPYDAAEPKIFFLPASQLAMALLKYEKLAMWQQRAALLPKVASSTEGLRVLTDSKKFQRCSRSSLYSGGAE